MPDPLRLKREQLAKFLPDFESIKAFENLFIQATETTPATSSEFEELLYSMSRKAPLPDSADKRISALEARIEQREPNLNDIYRQLNEIKAFLGMQ